MIVVSHASYWFTGRYSGELLRRDPREKERKKYGLRSTRKREQYSKR